MDDASAVTSLPDDPAILKQIIVARTRQCDELRQRTESLKQRLDEVEIAKLRIEMELLWFKKRYYGPRADDLKHYTDSAQLLLGFAGELESRPVNPEDLPAEIPAEEVKTVRRVRRGRRNLAAFDQLPVTRKEYDLREDEKPCPCCGTMREKIGEETSWQIEFIPARFERLEHVRFKYACKHCEQNAWNPNIELAQKPIQPIDKGMAGPGLLAYVVTSKFADYRVQGEAVSKMREGLSQPDYRIRLQTSSNCGDQESSWETSSQKARERSRQVRSAKTNASEPSKTCRKLIDDAKTGSGNCPGISDSDTCLRLTWHPAQRRRERGSGLDTEPWNLSSRCKERNPSGQDREGESIDAGHRGGTIRSSVERRVTRPERRGRVIQLSSNRSTAQAGGTHA
jgi:transposase